MRRALVAIVGLALLPCLSSAPLLAKDEPAKPAPPERTKAQRETDATAQRLLDSLKHDVAKIRGLAWKKPVPVNVFSRDELRAQLRVLMERDYPADERKRDERLFKRLGVLRPDEDVTEMSIKLFGALIAGYYDRETKRMVLVEGPMGKAQIPTLVHELAHALDDQHYDFETMEKAYEEDPDRFFAGRCLLEGCAELVRMRYETRNPDVARASFKYEISQGPEQKRKSKAREAVMKETPGFMVIPSLLHYRAGPALVSRAVGQNSLSAVLNGLYADPPTTQEQWLHPERWLSKERRDLPRNIVWPEDTVTSIGEDWSLFYEHPLGELDLAMLLDHWASIPSDKKGVRARPLPGAYGRPITKRIAFGRFVSAFAYRAASGWDGGFVKYLARDEKTPLMVLQAFAFDSEADAEEATEAFRRAFGALHGSAYKEAEPIAGTGAFTLPYETPHGRATMVRKRRVLRIVDGAPDADTLARALKTLNRVAVTLKKGDVGDVGATPGIPDPFHGCGHVDRRRGIGVPVPKGWLVRGSDQAATPLFATLGPKDNSLTITIQVLGMGLTPPNLSGLANLASPSGALGPGQPVVVADYPGRLWVTQRTMNVERRIVVASDGVRTLAVLVSGAPGVLLKNSQLIRDVTAGIVCVPGY